MVLNRELLALNIPWEVEIPLISRKTLAYSILCISSDLLKAAIHKL